MDEKAYLRELAKHQLELAGSRRNKALQDTWYAHNSLKTKRPLIVFEEETCKQEFLNLKCETPEARFLEAQMQQSIQAFEYIQDDKVIPNFLRIPVKISSDFFGIHQERANAEGSVGYHIEPVLEDLSEDLDKLSPSVFCYDKEGTEHLENLASDWLGDILPARRVNEVNQWHFGITQHVVNLMGMENMFFAMYDTPEEFHHLMQFLVDDMKRLLRWEEENGLIYPNAGNDYMGSGSYCFNNELPASGSVRSTGTWGHINSQESVGISPEMYEEFIFPYYLQVAKEFGLVYYGCCEPVHPIWDTCISKIPNLRKVSISAWCDEAYMAERLSSEPVIYSRKPTPNFLGVSPAFDEDAFRAYMANTVNLARDCYLEIIFRDIYTLHNNPQKAQRAIQIVRELIDS